MNRNLSFVAWPCCLLSALLAAPCWGGEVRAWRQAAAADFSKGTLSQVVVTREGQVRLGRNVERVADLQAAHAWDLVEGGDGSIYVATTDPGKVLRVSREGKVETVWAGPVGTAVFCLTASADGSLYAGTGPEGRIVRIAKDAVATEFAKLPAGYVWDMLSDAQGRLVVATGPDGKIFHIDAQGQATEFYDAPQPHLLCLALGPRGELFAGSDRDGLVYRMDEAGKGYVLYDATQDDIRALHVAADGTLYAATASAAATSARRAAPTAASSTPAAARPAANPQGPANVILAIAPDGTVREIFREPAMILALTMQGQTLWAATGMSALLYALEQPGGDQTQCARLDEEAILGLLPAKDGSLFLSTATTAKLYRLKDGHAANGTLVSDVFDAGAVSRWGAIRWQAELAAGSSLSLALRAGNVAEVDTTWDDWTTEMTDASAATAQVAPARFIQYRLTLATTNPQVSPSLSRLSVFYQTANQAPEISQLTVPHVDEGDGKTRQERLNLTWQARDPNQDELRYTLFFRKEGWKTWVRLAENVTQTNYSWDTSLVPGGTYRLRLVAGDAASNPESDALTAERVSDLFLVDHEPPKLALRVSSGPKVSVEVLTDDGLTRLVSAAYSLDGQPWKELYPRDRLFDSRSESLQFELPQLSPGTHVLMLRAVDAAGNAGTVDTTFEVP